MTRRQFAAGITASALLHQLGVAGHLARQHRPNILFILADDMGFSDIGCFGGEIATPNLDRLAAEGMRFTQFHNCAVCVPTRGAIMTGRYPHQVGCGDEWGPMNRDVPTIAERLRAAGYRTLLSGKWHLGATPGLWPTDRGFDSFFGLLGGGMNYFHARDAQLFLDDKPYRGPSEHFYLTDAITDHAIEMMMASSGAARPFFQAVTYTAPHFPLHAPADEIAKYRGKYLGGWDRLRTERYRRMVELGIINAQWTPASRSELSPDVSWEDLTPAEKDMEDLRMAVYAAQVDRMDQGIGRILSVLRDRALLDQTLVIFMSDNGACSAKLYETAAGKKAKGVPPGPENSYDAYGLPWASASNTPFRLYKSWLHEGGISTPFIVRHPRLVSGHGTILHGTVGHVIDLWPTFLDLAQGIGGDETDPNGLREGVSLLPAFLGRPLERKFPLCWNQWGGHAVRDGDWKIVQIAREASTNRLRRYRYTPALALDRWELYNIAVDRTEENDLALEHPEIVNRLAKTFEQWAGRTRLDLSKTRTDM